MHICRTAAARVEAFVVMTPGMYFGVRSRVAALISRGRADRQFIQQSTRFEMQLMNRHTLSVILLVSLSHALVHVYEFLFPSVEQILAAEWRLDAATIGLLAGCFALPFGLGALGAGWLADRVGSRIVLVIYLLGASVACLFAGRSSRPEALSLSLLALGSFASLYHPAGLAYISRLVPREELGPALGYHGILGSMGIAGTPILAATFLLFYPVWNGLYLAIVPAGAALAVLFVYCLPNESRDFDQNQHATDAAGADWFGFALVCLAAVWTGIIYRGYTTFLPRYLDDVSSEVLSELAPGSRRNYLTGGVLILGMIGQYLGGCLCRRFRLEGLLLTALALNVPFLLAMGFASPSYKLASAGAYAVVHFLWQPVGNSLIALYTPMRSRSLGYGISFLVSFGVGSVGGWYAGWLTDQWGVWSIYPGLAILAVLATINGVAIIVHRNRQLGRV